MLDGPVVRQLDITLERNSPVPLYYQLARYIEHAINVGDPATAAVASAGDLFLKNSILFDNANLDDRFPADIQKKDSQGNEIGEDDGGFDEEAHFVGEATNRTVDPKLMDAFNLDAPDFRNN